MILVLFSVVFLLFLASIWATLNWVFPFNLIGVGFALFYAALMSYWCMVLGEKEED